MFVFELGRTVHVDLTFLAGLLSVFLDPFQGFLNQASSPHSLCFVKLRKGDIMDPLAMISEPPHACQGLSPSNWIWERTKNQHGNPVGVTLRSEVEATPPVLVIDHVEGVAISVLHIHGLECEVRGIFSDEPYSFLHRELVVSLTCRVYEHSALFDLLEN